VVSLQVYTHEAWLSIGTARFGPHFEHWYFVCPCCGNEQRVGDFDQYRDRGASRASATKECIGRYMGATYTIGIKPCDYAACGLIRLSPVEVIMPDGTRRMSFAFATLKHSA
jgi:hypothetical protein